MQTMETQMERNQDLAATFFNLDLLRAKGKESEMGSMVKALDINTF